MRRRNNSNVGSSLDKKLVPETSKETDPLKNSKSKVDGKCSCSECNVQPNPEHEEPKTCWESCLKCCRRERQYHSRILQLGGPQKGHKFPPNVICNKKYNIITFIPIVLFEQFSLFVNLCFLIMACTQIVPALRISYLYTYWSPLAFVVCVTMIRELVDDLRRWRRDRVVNNARYWKLNHWGRQNITSSQIAVGDLIVVERDQRIPADMVLLRTTEKTGSCFIRTDQLDGETDWKLRLAVLTTQGLAADEDLFNVQAQIYSERPNKNIHSFEGTFTRTDGTRGEEALSAENAMWANTVLASGTAIGIVIYTGRETRAVMNSSQPRSKLGMLDLEVNNMTKILFFTVCILSFVMVALKGFGGAWYKYFWRFVLLFSYVIPLALRVNLDMAKIVTSWVIMKDKEIPGAIVRSTTIPEELGRISYLMTDKTGTLTKNEMVFKKLHLGSVAFASESMDEVVDSLNNDFLSPSGVWQPQGSSMTARICEAVRAIALCHNVTPVQNDDPQLSGRTAGSVNAGMEDLPEADQTTCVSASGQVTYQASSPDEVALVSWTETLGVTLVHRDITSMQLRAPNGTLIEYRILQNFPFTSETKRMGIIVREVSTGAITLYMKGADVVMTTMMSYADWLEEETGNMAREGLRTLVVARKSLSEEEYSDFEARLHQARVSTTERSIKVAATVSTLESGLDLVCLTGVEDKLQDNVRPTLELLRNAGIRVWMLTGDKLETAECIAKSSRLVGTNQSLHVIQPVQGRAEAHLELNAFRRHSDSALLITGESLQVCLHFYKHEFVDLACQCPAVIVCRCSPTQKAEIVRLLQQHSGKRLVGIGDGGNDVNMIQAADVGIGIVGKEGLQASLASDFSLTQFHHVARLLLVHGRNSYKNSASLSQFIIHRGMIITVMQAVFSAVFYFVAIPLFPGILMVGYATIFTMFPVFSLVLDQDVTDRIALTYPELYKDLTKGRELSMKTFFIWMLISIYQGGIIMYGALLLFEEDFVHVVSITFTSLILTELLMVALTIRTWHILMVLAELGSLAIYLIALVVLTGYFDRDFLISLGFLWKVATITAVSCIPLFILKFISFKLRPPIYSKLQEN